MYTCMPISCLDLFFIVIKKMLHSERRAGIMKGYRSATSVCEVQHSSHHEGFVIKKPLLSCVPPFLKKKKHVLQ